MIKEISSTFPTFKTLKFHSGLNVIIAKKTEDASSRQTRNRAGKSSIIETIHFLLAGQEPALIKKKALQDATFKMELTIGEATGYIKRMQGSNQFYSDFIGFSDTTQPELFGKADVMAEHILASTDLGGWLREQWFNISTDQNLPSFRQLINYFVRRANTGAFTQPLKPIQKDTKYQIPLMYLLGLDWRIAAELTGIRDKERTIKELKKARKEGLLSQYVGRSAAELQTEIIIEQNKLQTSQQELAEFRVLPTYTKLQQQADKLQNLISETTDELVILNTRIDEINATISDEEQPTIEQLEKVFFEAEAVIPSVIKERYEAVSAFHQSIIKNRENYLRDELLALQQQVLESESNNKGNEKELAGIMTLLDSHGALEQFSKLQSKVNQMEADLIALKKQHEIAYEIENLDSVLKIERARIEQRLMIDYTERSERVARAILAYEECSSRLYESAGTMQLKASPNGPKITFEIQGQGSAGITKMETFCFDMMLMQICAQQNIGPGFLVHDSELFDGVDGRQLVKALQIGAELAEKYGFQYIVTLNEDDAFKEKIKGFDLRKYQVNIDLNDHEISGGLFGTRF